jgi:hypothetical protein
MEGMITKTGARNSHGGVVLVAFAIAALAMPGVARAATITPTTTGDSLPNSTDAVCTLREAVVSMNNHSDFGAACTHTGTYQTSDTIELGANFYGLGGSAGEDAPGYTGDLDTYDPGLTIEGNGPTQSVIISPNDRAIDAHAPLNLVGLQVGGSHVSGSGPSGSGGGIRTTAPGLTLTNVTVGGNSASGQGGGIYTPGPPVTLVNSTVLNNVASIDGGGISGGATLTNSTVSTNHAGGNGGGVWGAFTVTGSTVSGNTASGGGGLWGNGTITDSTVANNQANANDGGGVYGSTGALTISRSTIAGNSTTSTTRESQGGGIYFVAAGSTLAITNSTISGNGATGWGGGLSVSSTSSSSPATANLRGDTINRNVADTDNSGLGHGGGIDQAPDGRINLSNTVVAGNTDVSATGPAADCNTNADPVTLAPRVISQGYNLFGATAGCTISTATGDQDLNGADPKIAPLADNGGATQTSALQSGSPAIDAGNPAAPASAPEACTTSDQRSLSRPQGPTCDVGAFEFPYRTLAVSLAGTGSGAVSGPGLSCGGTGGCSASYPDGTSVALTGTPVGDSTFDGFGGDCSGTGDCQLTMSTDRNVTASFTGYRRLSVSLAGTGSGTVTGPGLSCDATAAACSASYPVGTPVTLTAGPSGDSTFDGFGGDCSGTGDCQLTMSADRNVTATFTAPDTTPPSQTLRGGRRQKLKKLSVADSVSEPSDLIGRATLSLPGGKRRLVKSKTVTAEAGPGNAAKLRFKFSRRKMRSLKKALAHGRRLKVTIRVKASDAAGNASTATKRVRLRGGHVRRG